LQTAVFSLHGNGFEFAFFHNLGKVRATLIALYKPFSDSMACRLIKPADLNLICLKNHFSAN
jgi:hypothetical protein